MLPRPSALPPFESGIPDALKARPQWIVWAYGWDEAREKWIKQPYSVRTGRLAKYTRPESWGSFEEAHRCYLRSQSDPNGKRFDGIGYVFAADDPFCGIDFDRYRDPDTGEIAPEVVKLLELLATYAEISVSGTGVHAIAEAVLPPGRNRKGMGKAREEDAEPRIIELYDHARYFTVTGRRLTDFPEEIRPAQEAVSAIHQALFREERKPQAPAAAPETTLDDEALLEHARRSKNGSKFERLWAGDTGGYPSASEATMALCALLAFWTDDPYQVDRLVRRSGLYRDKWDERRGDSSWGWDTVEKAFEGRTARYEAKSSRGGLSAPARTHKGMYSPPEDTPFGVSGNQENGRNGNGHHPPGDPPPVAPKPFFHLTTDLGLAYRFAEQHGRDLLYCAVWNQWLLWDEKRWAKDRGKFIETRAHLTVERLWQEVRAATDLEEQKLLTKFALESQRDKNVRAMLNRAMAVETFRALPEQFDQHRWLLNVANATIDLATGEARPHERSDRLTQLANILHDPAATCPRFDDFLDEIMAGNRNMVAFLWRAIGYSLTGEDRERVLFILQGAGRNGKSTLLEVIRQLLGDYGHKMRREALLAKNLQSGKANPEIANLFGKRFAYLSETEEGGRLNEALVKELTGQEMITVRRLYQDEFGFEPTFKIWISSNHRPVIHDTTDSIWDRIGLIPFPVRFFDPSEHPDAPHQVDRTLKGKLLAELPGILNRAVAGAREYHEDGLGIPKEVRTATAEYRGEMDVLQAFLNERCVTRGAGLRIRALDLFVAFKAWCDLNGERFTPSQRQFNRLLEERNTFRKRTGTGGYDYWEGLALKDEEHEAPVDRLF
jgi:putative DNA primase/helicase